MRSYLPSELHANQVAVSMTELPFDLSQADAVIMRQRALACAFRERMTKDQSFEASNEYRKHFYKEVTKMANVVEVNFCAYIGLFEMTNISKFTQDKQVRERDGHLTPRYVDHKGVLESATNLRNFIDPHGTLSSPQGPQRPLVILAFDESHLLTDNPKDTPWNLFFGLRRTLREMVKLPIFSLFLSTAGRFHEFSPEIRSDPSTRIMKADLFPLDPISEISFDDLAFPAEENTVTLDRVVQMDWIAHLGRPL
jgi:hypothetical protein